MTQGKKKALLILNPKAGVQGARRNFYSIIAGLSKKYIVTTHITSSVDDAIAAARDEGCGYDVIICCGGDGTVSQVINGYPAGKKRPIIGYIPCGTANDFASSLKLSKNIGKAVSDICAGRPVLHDIGRFNGKNFIYIASFGAFTKVSYTTPQDAKNLFGSFAYFINGAFDLGSIRGEKVTVECNNERYSYDDVCFFAVMNTLSVGSVLKFNEDTVLMNDGEFELLLIRLPKNIVELSEIVGKLSRECYDDSRILFLKSNHYYITTENEIRWTLDGEDAGLHRYVAIDVMNKAVSFIRPGTQSKS